MEVADIYRTSQKSYIPCRNINVPHKSRDPLKPTGVLHSGAVAYCDVTILEPGGETTAAAGVRYIPMTVQSRREVLSDGTSAFIHRKEERQKSPGGSEDDVCPQTSQSERSIFDFYTIM